MSDVKRKPGYPRGELMTAYVAICATCGATEMRNQDAFTDRAAALRNFKKAGWSHYSGRHLCCSSCTALRKANRKATPR